jgi:hypothetical protein
MVHNLRFFSQSLRVRNQNDFQLQETIVCAQPITFSNEANHYHYITASVIGARACILTVGKLIGSSVETIFQRNFFEFLELQINVALNLLMR